MSYIKIHSIKKTVGKTIKYITNEKKTDGQKLISDSGFGWKFAEKTWEKTREKFGKNNGILAHHVIQSFDPKHKITPEEAHKIGVETAQKQFGKKGFDFIVATHVDTGVIHNHILVNSVSRFKGEKYKDNKATYRNLRKINIETCRENGIDAVDTLDYKKRYKGIHYTKTKAYDKWLENRLNNSERIRKDIDKIIKEYNVKNFDDFINKMKELGYEIKYKAKNGDYLKYMSFKPLGAERFRRDRTLGQGYTREAIIRRIEIERNREDRLSELEKRKIILKEQIKRYKEVNPYISPKWERINNIRIKPKYRKRSYLESLLINQINKINNERRKELQSKKIELSSIEKQIAKQREKESIEKIKKYVEKLKFINENHIESLNDIESSKKLIKNKIQELEKNFETINDKIKVFENIIKLIDIKNKNESIVEKLTKLEGKEQEEFLNNNRKKIEDWKIATRYLQKENIDISKYDEYKERYKLIFEKFEQLKEKRDNLLEKEEKYFELEKEIKSINSVKLQVDKSKKI